MIVEDSAVVSQHLKQILESDGEIRVIGIAENGLEAVDFVNERMPDVITMDINMPKMNGMEATRRIMETRPLPIVIVTASYNRQDLEKSFLAMEAGAVAIMEKPFGEGHPEFSASAKNLIQTVKLMAEVKVVKRWPKMRVQPPLIFQAPEPRPGPQPKNIKLVAIGASTGGPPVIQTILLGLHRGFPVPVLIVQHISRGFLEGMIDWLRQTTSHPVHIAAHGERLLPGHFYFAPDDIHVGVGNGDRIEFSKAEPENGIRPSVSYLFRSALSLYGSGVVGVLLTGMGKDGAQELKMLKDKGAVTIVQDRESSVVYGMPGEAVRIDAAVYVLSPERISSEIESLVK